MASDKAVRQGSPLSIAVTLVDGLVVVPWAPGCGQESFPSSWPPGLRCPPRTWSRVSISRTI